MPTKPPALAEPTVPDPMEAPPLRWGVLGPGGIANVFASAVREGTRSEVVAVGSRSADRASVFARRHGAARSYGSYEALVADEGVDAVYVASPHSEHREHALLALSAGKPVLVEKAFARNLAEVDEVLDAARGAGLLAAEAMWSRYLPQYDVVRRTVEAGTLGDLVLVQADHGQRLWPDGPQRLADPALAGGAPARPRGLPASPSPTTSSARSTTSRRAARSARRASTSRSGSPVAAVTPSPG